MRLACGRQIHPPSHGEDDHPRISLGYLLFPLRTSLSWLVDAWHVKSRNQGNCDTSTYQASISGLLEQLLHRLDLVLGALLLVCPRSHPDVALNPHNAILMQHTVTLSNDPHHIIPGALCIQYQHEITLCCLRLKFGLTNGSPCRVHRVGQSACL